MIVEFAVLVVAVAFAVLVGYLVPMVIQIRRTVSQSERLLARLNGELPLLLKELKGTSENVHAMTTKAREGVDHASVLLTAVGEVGYTVKQVHGAVRGKGTTFLVGLTSVLAGLKAASTTIKDRIHKTEGGKDHGR